MGKQKIIPVLAMTLLLIGIISALYVSATQINKDTIKIIGQEYTVNDLYILGGEKTIETANGEITGASLENIIKSIGVSCTSCNKYTIKGADGYPKTIEWDILKTGVLTEENRVCFPDTPKALWVRDVVEIEVN
jgi:hypothetical protein